MVAKPLTTEFVALTEKKMDMSLDDIIKMSKNTTNSWKQKRVPNKSQNFSNTVTHDKSLKMRRYMESRSSVRQGFIAKRRSNFQGNQFPLANERAQKAVADPLHFKVSNQNKIASWNKTRLHIPVSQRRADNGGFAAKRAPSPQQQQQQQEPHRDANIMPKQRPQTLDSLFANMREQRMKVFSSQNNAVLHNGAGAGGLNGEEVDLATDKDGCIDNYMVSHSE